MQGLWTALPTPITDTTNTDTTAAAHTEEAAVQLGQGTAAHIKEQATVQPEQATVQPEQASALSDAQPPVTSTEKAAPEGEQQHMDTQQKGSEQQQPEGQQNSEQQQQHQKEQQTSEQQEQQQPKQEQEVKPAVQHSEAELEAIRQRASLPILLFDLNGECNRSSCILCCRHACVHAHTALSPATRARQL